MIKVAKRDGTVERFDKKKIYNAVFKSSINSKYGTDSELASTIADLIEEKIKNKQIEPAVENIQDEVENLLMSSNRKDVAKKYIIYRDRRTEIRNSKWDMDELQKSIWKNKYQYKDESFNEWIERISGGNPKIAKLIRERKFLFAGRILANRGLYRDNIKVTYSNCYVLEPPEDNLESIFDTAKNLARTFSYGGGVGIDISKLRPNGAKVHNAAKTTSGAVSFMDLYSMTTGLIGQKGRRGALMISMDISHPDIEEFIDVKTDLQRVTKANISVKVTDEFMNAVKNKEKYKCRFIIESSGEEIIKEVDAHELFMKLIKNNWDYAEPGILFWDNIRKNHLLSEDKEFKYDGVNPCAEEPLPAGGSCLLGSMNLAEFVVEPFTDNAIFDMEKFKGCVEDCILGLNEVLDEGLPLHPLKEQQKSVSQYRQIGLGVMGIADMLIKLNIRYGSIEAIKLCEEISKNMLNSAVKKSALIAKEKGAFEKYNEEALFKSPFFIKNINEDVKEIVKKYMNLKDISDEKDLPDIFVTAMNLKASERIAMQRAWQKYIDASISSTINLPYEATKEDVYNIYMSAWENKLKGITIYRDGCERSGVLLNDKNFEKENKQKEEKVKDIEKEHIEENHEKFTCPECGNETVIPTGGCTICLQCGYSKCN